MAQLSIGKNVETYEPVVMTDEMRLRHTLIMGKSGSGKSNLMLSCMLQDAAAEQGFILLDPYGNLAEDFLARVPAYRAQDVVLVDFGDLDYPIGLNLFDTTGMNDEDEYDRRVNAVMEAFRRSWPGSDSLLLVNWAETIARTFMDSRRGTLYEVSKLLTDKGFRDPYLRRLDHSPSLDFWNQYTNRDGTLSREAINVVANRLRLITGRSAMRNIVGQSRSMIDFDQWIHEKKLVIIHVPDTLGAEQQRMLGSFLMQRCLDAARRRPRDDRDPYFLYVDEFHYFATTDMLKVINGMRQFGLGLIVATQQLNNIRDEEVRRGISGAGSMILFDLTPDDARVFAPSFRMEPSGPATLEWAEPDNQVIFLGRWLVGEGRDWLRVDFDTGAHKEWFIPLFQQVNRNKAFDDSELDVAEKAIGYLDGYVRWRQGKRREPEKPYGQNDTHTEVIAGYISVINRRAEEAGATSRVVPFGHDWHDFVAEDDWTWLNQSDEEIAREEDWWTQQVLAGQKQRAEREAAMRAKKADEQQLEEFVRYFVANPILYHHVAVPGEKYTMRDALPNLSNLYARGVAVCKLEGRGEVIVRTPLVNAPLTGIGSSIRNQSRQEYCRSRTDVEREIASRLNAIENYGEPSETDDPSPTTDEDAPRTKSAEGPQIQRRVPLPPS